MTRPSFGSIPCPKCNIVELNLPVFDHFIREHSPFEDQEQIEKLLRSQNPNLTPIVAGLLLAHRIA